MFADIRKCLENIQRRQKAVNNVNLKIAKGEFICFIGPSGQRKNNNNEND